MVEELSLESMLDDLRARFIRYTRKAFEMLPKLESPSILDIGCGSGLVTLELARLSDGEIIGIDINQSLLEKLKKKFEDEGFSSRVKAIKCSLFEIDFPDESFDVIWAEGSIWIIGFEKGLKQWNRLLKPYGFIVIHDEIQTISSKLREIPNWGYKLINHFSLPEDAWWTEYYQPLERQIRKLRIKYQNNLQALKVIRKHQNGIDLFKRNPKEHSSVFYILQKNS
jgi:ubiquinone/menaquinone biosynthesis C-methylase UbiE